MTERDFVIAIVSPAFVPVLAFLLLVALKLLPARARRIGAAVLAIVGVAAFVVSWRDDLRAIDATALVVAWYTLLCVALLSMVRRARRFRRTLFVALSLLLFPPILFPFGFGFYTMNFGLALASGLAGQLPRAFAGSAGFHLVSFAAVGVVAALVALWLLRDASAVAPGASRP
jgi:hypothetical protein